jgi:hypothetical protein
MLLFARLGGADLRRMTHLAVDPQVFHQFQKPVHRPGSFHPHQNLAGECGIKLPHFVAIVLQFFSTNSPVSVSNIASDCCRVCKSQPIIPIDASFGSSAVRVNTETVYSRPCEAVVVMTAV